MVTPRNVMLAKSLGMACLVGGIMGVSAPVSAKVAQRADAAPVAAQPNATPPMTRTDLVAKIRARFDALDTNHDGYVSQPELAAGMAAEQARVVAEIRRQRSAAFDAMDTNHDGQLSREEFLAGGPRPGPLPDAAAFIAKLDTNKDGSLTFAEFSARALAAFDQRQSPANSQTGR